MDEAEVINNKERRLTHEDLINIPLNYHKIFSEKWKIKYGPDFHNKKHIQTLLMVSERYLKKCEDGKDPLNVLKSIEAWNKKNSGFDLNLEKFKKAAALAFAWHDMGNIASDVNFENDTPEYLDNYTSGKLTVNGTEKTAEERSADIFLKVLEQSDIDDDEKKLYEKLVPELILLSEYREDVPIEEDFSLFVAAVDQLGNSYLNDDKDKLRGLIYEFAYEFGEDVYQINPLFVVRFAENRTKAMLGDDAGSFLQMIGAVSHDHPEFDEADNRDMPWRDAVKVLADQGL